MRGEPKPPSNARVQFENSGTCWTPTRTLLVVSDGAGAHALEHPHTDRELMTKTTIRRLPLGIGLIGVLTWMSAPAATHAATTAATQAAAPTGCNAVASVKVVGPGAGGPSGAPELELVGAPAIGGPFAFRVSGGPSNATGVLVCAQRGQERFLPVYGATFYPKNLRILESFTLDANGVSPALLSQSALSAGACGSTWVCQAVIDDWTASGGRSFTQGLRLRFGRSDGEAGTQLPFSVGVTGGSFVRDLAIGDLDSDGVADLLTCEGSGSLTHAYLGVGDGTYAAPLITDLGFSMFRFMQIPDLTADGIPDLVVVQGPSNNLGSLRTFVGLGGGQFSAYATSTLRPDPRGLTVGDLDSDGMLDVIVPTWGHGANPQFWGELTVFYGSGSGSFSQTLSFDYIDYNTAALIEDMNGDGINDIVSATDFSPGVYTHIGYGNRLFPWTLPGDSPLTNGVDHMATGDFNGDGIPDLVVTNFAAILVKLGVGDGTYVDGENKAFSYVNAIETADLSGDGVLDLAVAYSAASPGGGIAVFLGKGDGTFADVQQVSTGGNASRLLVLDIDGDGDLDLAGTRWSGTTSEFITLLQD